MCEAARDTQSGRQAKGAQSSRRDKAARVRSQRAGRGRPPIGLRAASERPLAKYLSTAHTCRSIISGGVEQGWAAPPAGTQLARRAAWPAQRPAAQRAARMSPRSRRPPQRRSEAAAAAQPPGGEAVRGSGLFTLTPAAQPPEARRGERRATISPSFDKLNMADRACYWNVGCGVADGAGAERQNGAASGVGVQQEGGNEVQRVALSRV